MFAKSCVFGKQSALPILCSYSLGLILVSLLRYFAEFLKDYSSLTFVFSTCLLVSDWYSFSKKRLFPIISLSSTHRSSPFGVLGLGAASPYSLGFRSIFRCSLLILAFSHSIFLRIVLLPIFFSEFRCGSLPPEFLALYYYSNALLRVLSRWLFPSLLLRCLRCRTFLTLSDPLYDLNFGSGLFPF